MREQLAERLLGRVMGWDGDKLAEYGDALQMLARYKYDAYGMFRPGERFLEALSRALLQLNSGDERRTLVEFVLRRLVFISAPEMDHAITLVYPDFIRPLVQRNVALATGIPRHRVKKLTAHSEFKSFQRKILILGMSDGARLDQLRRASPELSHEQFNLVATPSIPEVTQMKMKLEGAVRKMNLNGVAQFEHVVLVDDFTGSGYTLLHFDKPKWGGKLIRIRDRLDEFRAAGLLAQTAAVTVIIYVASEAASDALRSDLVSANLAWQLHVIQMIPLGMRVADAPMEALCKKHYDPVLTDEHKGAATMGYRDSRLPLILFHNTPNNSICILWGDTSDRAESTLRRHALFPRYERHSADRP